MRVPSRLLRALAGCLVLVAVGLAPEHDALAQTGAQQPIVRVRTEVVRNRDGFPIQFSYYPASDKVNGQDRHPSSAPVIVLIHGAGGNRLFWDKTSAPPSAAGKPEQLAFAPMLQQLGYAVIAVDMRKHGDSVKTGENKVLAGDYNLMVGDLVALKDFIYLEHQAQRLNMRMLGIVAMDVMVPVVANFAEYDWKLAPYDDSPLLAECTPRGQDVKLMVFISPETTAGKVQSTAAMRFLAAPDKRIGFLVMAGKKDEMGAKKANTLYKLLRGNTGDERVQLKELPTNEKSGHLFGKPTVIGAEPALIAFLNANLGNLNIPWQDRRSRLDRDPQP